MHGDIHLSEVAPLKPGLARDGLTPFLGQRPSFQLILIALFVLLFTTSIVLATRWVFPAGTSRQPGSSAIAETATPATRWTGRAALPTARKGMGAVEYNNAFYLIAGETASGPDGSLHRYSPLEDSWQTLTPKPIPVTDVQAALIGERIYVPGGRLANGSDSAVLEVYDPREDSWSQLAPLPAPVSAYALAAFEGNLYLFGGKSGEQYLTSVYEYVPDEDRWQARTRLQSPLAYAGAAVVGNRIFLIGGFDGKQALDSNLAYHPARDINGEPPWEEFTSLPAGRYAIAITTLSNVIYIAGGLGNNQLPAAPLTLQYLPQANQWASYDSPAVVLGAHGVMLPSEGFLHYLGGGDGQELANLHQSFQALYYNAIPLIQKDK
jgi:N-acetylneuraminic acid mutarotase